MLRAPKTYLSEPGCYQREYAATYDHSWRAQGVDAQEKIAQVAGDDAAVARILRLQLAFGLRIQEASLLQPSRDTVGDRYLRIVAGTKGGRPRVVPIETGQQRMVLDEAHEYAGKTGRSMIPPEYELGQWLRHCRHILARNGITRKAGLVSHGLRHQYANDTYEQLTGVASPVRGGLSRVDTAQDRRARLDVSGRLGHAREAITEAYYGKADAVPAAAQQAKQMRKHFYTQLRVQQQLLVERIRRCVGERNDGRGQVSETTLAHRGRLLHQMVKTLLVRGEPLETPDTLNETHINILLPYWSRSAGITKATARNNVQLLAQLCQWLGKPELALLVRGHWQELKRGDTKALPCPLAEAELHARLAAIGAQDPRAAAQIELVRVLGLSHVQAARLPLAQMVTGDYLDVLFGVPAGQVLRFAIITERQRAVLAQALQAMGDQQSTLCPPETPLNQWLQHVFQLLREVGRIDIPGQPTLLELQDSDAPTPRILPREAWLMHRAGLAESSPMRHLYRFRA